MEFIKRRYTTNILKIIILLTIFMAYFFILPVKIFVNRIIFVLSMDDVELIKAYILSYGSLAPIISAFLMILKSTIFVLSKPYILDANLSIFGLELGFLISYVSKFISAMLCFGITRFFLADMFEKFFPKLKQMRISTIVYKNAGHIVFILRIFPCIPYDLVSYGLGLSKIKVLTYLKATALGQLVWILVYSINTRQLSDDVKNYVIAVPLLIVISLDILIKNQKGKTK